MRESNAVPAWHDGPIPLGVLVGFVVVAVVAVREVSVGRTEVAAAEASAARSEWPEAISHARAAAEARVPGSPWPDRGKVRLEAMGHDAEARGDDETALLAYGALRTAAIATRAPFATSVSTDRWRLAAEGGLARVAARQTVAGNPSSSPESMLNDLRDLEAPAAWKLALLAAASLAVIVAAARLVWRGDGARGAQTIALLGFMAYAITLLVG
jgi:hypothetical protein